MKAYFTESEVYYKGQKLRPIKRRCHSLNRIMNSISFVDDDCDLYMIPAKDISYEFEGSTLCTKYKGYTLIKDSTSWNIFDNKMYWVEKLSTLTECVDYITRGINDKKTRI